MRRATLLTMMVALILALAASVAVAANVNGTAKNDRLVGTNKADRINGKGGNDKIYGKNGNDKMIGAPGNDLLSGSGGDDNIVAGLGKDQVQASGGDDTIKADNGDVSDQIFCGSGFDVARVDINDLVGGSKVGDILEDVTAADATVLTCEVLVVDGLRIPLGAIVALPAAEESRVSLVLEEFFRDGQLSDEERADLEELFALILQIEGEDDPGLLEELLGDLGALLDGLLGGILG
jgi:Ca2+-binding RTX toxin-like protein